jgi:hypothetical protein
VADLLGISRQAVDLRRASGKLLAIDLGLRKNLYPRWQFTEEGILAGLEETLAVLREGATTPWSCLRFFLSGNLRLGWRAPARPPAPRRDRPRAPRREGVRHARRGLIPSFDSAICLYRQ